jgi:hypothetical protein
MFMHTVWNTTLQSEQPTIDDVVDRLHYRPNQPATCEPAMHCQRELRERDQECSYVGALGQKSMGGIKKADTQKIKAVSKKGINTHATAG